MTGGGVFGQEEAKVIVQTLIAGTTTFPVATGAGGFTWRFDPGLGTFTRRSESFGPLFAERPLTNGRRKLSIGVTFQHIEWDSVDGQSLDNFVIEDFDDGSFQIHIGSRLHLRTERTTVSATYGLTDRIDVGADIPFARMSVSGANLFSVTFPGEEQFTQRDVEFDATSSGLSDVLLRGKVLAFSRSGVDAAALVNLRLPTGDADNLLGVGTLQTKLMAVLSVTRGPVASHLNIGYLFGGEGLRFAPDPNLNPPTPRLVDAHPTDEFDYTVGADIAASPWLTIAGDVIGRSLRHSAEFVLEPFEFGPPTNVLLKIVPGTVNLVLGTVGCKVRVGGMWLVTGGVVFSLSDNGLTSHVTPVVGVERAF
jgi:hypothetical protein